jgi:hypothetical protein
MIISKMVYTKFLQRYANTGLSEFEMKNIAIAKTTIIPKDKPTTIDNKCYEHDIRPLMIANINIRLAINATVIINMDNILKQKHPDQYGIGTKDSLLLIIKSFDRYCYYKNMINKHMKIEEEKYNTNDDTTMMDIDYYQIISNFDQENHQTEDKILDAKIIELLQTQTHDINHKHIIMGDDQKNCFNRIRRQLD